MNTKLSVIIPVYNTEKYLKRCLESIINQTLKELEIIIINDGSTDNSDIICSEYVKKDKRIKYIITENKGGSSARNIGIQEATSDFITFVDSDDFIDKNMYEKMLEKLITEKTDFIMCGHKVITERNTERKKLKEESSLILQDGFSSVWNKIFKINILKENNILFPEQYQAGEDLVFSMKYLFSSLNGYSIVKGEFYNYVVRGDSISFKFIDQRTKLIEAYKDIFEDKRHKSFIEELKILFKKQICKDYFNGINRVIYKKRYSKDDKLKILKSMDKIDKFNKIYNLGFNREIEKELKLINLFFKFRLLGKLFYKLNKKE